MSTGHTWPVVERKPCSICGRVSLSRLVIDDVTYCSGCEGRIRGAAFDLLAALEEALAELESLDTAWRAKTYDIRRQARAAINKAQGQE